MRVTLLGPCFKTGSAPNASPGEAQFDPGAHHAARYPRPQLPRLPLRGVPGLPQPRSSTLHGTLSGTSPPSPAAQHPSSQRLLRACESTLGRSSPVTPRTLAQRSGNHTLRTRKTTRPGRRRLRTPHPAPRPEQLRCYAVPSPAPKTDFAAGDLTSFSLPLRGALHSSLTVLMCYQIHQ